MKDIKRSNDFEEAAKKDEEEYIKNSAELLRKATLESSRKRENDLKAKNIAGKALRQQMEEKNAIQ